MELKFGKSIILQRMLALFIDWSLVALTFLFVMTPFFNNTILKNDEYQTALNVVTEMKLDSGLFAYDDDGLLDYSAGESREAKLQVFYTKYDGNLDNFDKRREPYLGVFYYIDSKTNKYLVLDGINEEKYDKFLTEEVKYAYKNVLCVKDEEFKKNNYITSSYESTVMFSSLIVPFIFYFYFLPMLLKNGTTIGKKVFKLKIVFGEKNEPIKEGMYTLRFLLICLEILPFGILYLASGIVALLNKKGIAFHDYVVHSIVVSESVQEISKEEKQLEEEEKLDGNK